MPWGASPANSVTALEPGGREQDRQVLGTTSGHHRVYGGFFYGQAAVVRRHFADELVARTPGGCEHRLHALARRWHDRQAVGHALVEPDLKVHCHGGPEMAPKPPTLGAPRRSRGAPRSRSSWAPKWPPTPNAWSATAQPWRSSITVVVGPAPALHPQH